MTKVKPNCCVRVSHTYLFTLSLGAEKTVLQNPAHVLTTRALAGRDFLTISNEAALAFVKRATTTT